MFSEETEKLFLKIFGVDAIFGSRRMRSESCTYKAYCRLMRIRPVDLS